MKKFVLSIVFFLTAVFFLSLKADAQGDVQYCQNEYNARRSTCIANDNKCSASCGENQVCWDACNKERNICDEAAVIWQKECLGLNTNNQEMPMVDLQPVSVVSKTAPKPSATPKVQDLQPETETNAVNEWIKNNFGDLDIKKIEAGPQLERQPLVTEDQTATAEAPAQDQFYLGLSYTNGLVKLPGSQEFTDFQDIWHIPTGSTVRAMDKPIRINIGTKKVMIIAPNSEAVLTSDRKIDILKGTIEVRKEGIFSKESEQKDGVSTEFIDLFVIGTYYWVTHEPGKQTLVGVYKGEVEVKTKDGKVVNVRPNEDRPGVVVISQKISPVKLGIVGLVLAGIVGGIILLLRKKLTSKGFSKKKK